jgi:Tfp pilus tip-associated adhesin PilY1
MNKKKTVASQACQSFRQALVWALVVSSMISTPVLSAQTDISSSPITSTNAAQVKPNIMLLMDTSFSMGWGHMPDEVESQVGFGAIGYKAAECNVLYYNRNQTYALPKKADGTLFPSPSFTAARYDAFDISSSTLVNLATSFKAYDNLTLRFFGNNDTPQPAYYYYKTGGTVPITAYNSSPCLDPDVNATTTSSDNGSWNRVIVGASSGVSGSDERTNFAIWYAYYRTRMLLIKSAASLAFTPLTDSFRVGLISARPKDNPTDAAINADKYLAIDDFTSTQRGLWYDKLFAQKPAGSSPMREGLARVGRHYAGKQDGINQGMTGDPVQFSCQQNFTIMTTDGYWNGQEESTGLGGGFIGGGVDIEGKTLVGQRDGNLNALTTNNPSPAPAVDFNGTPRPIWDGTFDGVRTIRTRTVHNEYRACGAYFSMTTSQQTVSTSQLQKTTSQTREVVTQRLQSTVQRLQSTTQTLRATSQPTRSTFQTLRSTHQNLRNTTQRLASTAQATESTIQHRQTTNQNRQSTFQNLANSSQGLRVETRTEKVVYIPRQTSLQNLQSTTQRRQSTSQLNHGTVQNLQSTAQNTYTRTSTARDTSQTTRHSSQMLQRTEQNLGSTTQMLQRTEQTTQSTSQTSASTLRLDMSTSQLRITTSQTRRSTSQQSTCDGAGENCVPGPPGSCVAGGSITCETVSTGPTLVASCLNEPADSTNNYRAVTCATTVNAPIPAGACTAATADASNSYTTTTCSTATTGPTAVASCSDSIAYSGNAYTATTCVAVATGPTYVSSCLTSGPNGGNGYTATTCSTNTTGPTGVASCAPQTGDSTNNYLTITCGTNNTVNTAVASCSPVSAASGNSWKATICTPNNTSNVPVASCTNSGPTVGNGHTTTTCSTNNSADTPVQTCSAVAATGPSFIATVCTTNNSSTASGSCVPDAATSLNDWTTVTCPTVTTSTPLVDPYGTCVAAAGNSSNSWTTTTCTDTVAGPFVYSVPTCFAAYNTGPYRFVCTPDITTDVPVATCNPASPNAGNSYTTTTCTVNASALTPVASCTPVAADGTNTYTATVCPVVTTTNVGVSSCTADPTPTLVNNYTVTTCNQNDTTNVPVQTCTVSGPTLGNGYTDTTCSTNNPTNVAVASCTPQTAAAGNSWIEIQCPPETLVSGPTVVGSCTPDPATSANGYQRTDCNSVVVSTPVQIGTCVPDPPSSANGWIGTTCTTATASTPVLACTPQTADASNNWVEIVCGTNNQLDVPVLSCTPSGPTSANSWTNTTCPAPIVTGPTGVASCTPVAAQAANNWTSIACPPPVTTGPTGVQTCTNIPGDSANSWVTTTCGTSNTSNVAVQTCVDEAASGSNEWRSRTCSDNNTVNEPVATCTAQTATSSNGWVTITCPAPVVTTDVPVASCAPDPFPSGVNNFTTTTCRQNDVLNTPTGSCAPIAPNLGNDYTTTTCPTLLGPALGASSCAPQTGDGTNNWLTITCTPNDTTDVGVASCTDSGPTSGNGYTTITCRDNNTTDVGVASCSAGPATAGNAYTTTTCRDSNSDLPSGSCVPVTGSSGNGWRTTSCPVVVVGPVGASSCSASGPNGGNSWTTTTCPGTHSTGPTPTSSCTNTPADSLNSWTTTTCSGTTSAPTIVTSCSPSGPTSGNGYTTTTCTPVAGKERYTTTFARTQVFNVSGGVQASTGTDNTVTTGPTAAGTCHAPGAEPPLPPNGADAWTLADAVSYPSCSGWPCTIDASTGDPRSINSLADVAQYYYVTDLRTAANEPRGIDYYRDDVPAVGGGAEDDQARWQHMTTMAVGLGVSGTLQYRSDYRTAATGDFAEIRTGPRNWPLWPDPALDYSIPTSYNNPKSIDDFWHAAVAGRGTFYSAANPNSVIAGLAAALAGITARVSASTGAGTSNLEPVNGDNFAYLASYTTQSWTGDVQAREINVLTGAIDTTVIWSAQTLLDAATSGACDNRKILLFRAGATDNLTNFSWNSRACDLSGNPTGAADTGLNATEQAFFNSSNVALLSQHPSMTDGSGVTPNQRADAAGENLVNFLRGQRGLEGFVSGTANKLYRQRTHVLGDIVNGQPTYVRAPFASYADNGYGSFKASHSGRTPMVYVAANDGMLHAFYAGTTTTDPMGGKEAWAFMPSSVLPNLFKLADFNYKNIHQYFVDGAPSVSDIHDGSNWKTILVGGLNDGGKAYYALDVTDPVAPKALWEFKWSNTCFDPTIPATATADCHLGKTFGKPLISKLADGRWVVMVTSGYNNVNTTPKTGDGKGYLYVLNALNGEIIYKIATSAGDATTPSGLAQINNYVEKAEIDNTTRHVYGTDVLGNIWRFDINDNTAPSGREATLVGTATDASGVPQPITVRPELTKLGDKPMLFVATGKLLGATDTTDLQRQSIYGIVDPVVGTTAFPALRTALAPLRMTQVGSRPTAHRTVACTGTTAQCDSTDGWYVDLPDTGERVNVEMKLRSQTLIIGSNVPLIGPCSAGGYSWLNYLNFKTGLASTASIGQKVSVSVANALIVGLTVIYVTPGGPGTPKEMRFIITTTEGPMVLPGGIPTPDTRPKRISWREVLGR